MVAGNQFNLDLPANLFKDVDHNDALTYTAKLNNGNALPSWLKFDPATQRFTGVANNSDAGTITVEITATDKSGATAKTTYDIKVVANAVNLQNGSGTNTAGDGQGTGQLAAGYSGLNPGRTSGQTNGQVPDPSGLGNPSAPAFDPNALIDNAPTAAGPQDVDFSDSTTFELASIDINGHRDDFMVAIPSGATFDFSLPGEIVLGAEKADIMALQMNGEPLPSWLHFDPATGKFFGKAPKDAASTIRIQIVGKDAQGNERVLRVSVVVDATVDGVREIPAGNQTAEIDSDVPVRLGDNVVKPRGRAGLSEQFKMAAKRGGIGDGLAKAAARSKALV